MKTIADLQKMIPSTCMITDVTEWYYAIDSVKGVEKYVVFRNVSYTDGIDPEGMTSDVDSFFEMHEEERAKDRVNVLNAGASMMAQNGVK